MRALIFILSLSGCATADYAQVADSWTTAVALEAGFSEGDPLFGGAGWPVIAAAKLGVTQVVKLTPDPVCSAGLFGLTVTGVGAAAWNIGVMLGSGLAALPFAGAIIWHNWGVWQEHAVRDCGAARQWLEEIHDADDWTAFVKFVNQIGAYLVENGLPQYPQESCDEPV